MLRFRSVGEQQSVTARRLVSVVSTMALMTSVFGVVPVVGQVPAIELSAPVQVAVATPAYNDVLYAACGRVFSDPHAYWPSPMAATGESPYAKGNAGCRSADFLSYADMITGMEYLETLFPDFVDFQKLEEDYGGGQNCATTTDANAMCSAGLPTLGGDGLGRTRSDLYMVRLTDESVPDTDKKRFSFPLSIHGVERAGAEAGVRIAEDLAVWGYCEAVSNATLTPNGKTNCAQEGAIPHPLMETLGTSVTAGAALAESEIYLVFANPDGWRRGDADNVVRSYQRYNGNGVDMNRDWPTAGFTYRPYTPWSEPETKAFGEAMQSIAPAWDGGIDLHGQNDARAFSFTLMGASQRDFAKNQRILQTVKGAYEDAENRLAWSPLIKANNESPDDPRLYGVQWGTVWDTINYTVTGSLGDWIDSPIGLNADGIDNEMSFSHIYNCGTGTCYVANNEQLHVDGNKSLVYAMVNFTLLPESTDFDVPGDKVGYVLDDTVLSKGPTAAPPTYVGFPQQAAITGVVLDSANNWTYPFSILGPADGFYNGGVAGTVTNFNIGGVSPASLNSLILERWGNTEQDPPGLDSSCADSADDWETVNSYFNQSVIYLQAGQAVHANAPLPGKWRICMTGDDTNNVTSPIATLDISFTAESAWADPGQVAYSDVTNMNFFAELAPFMAGASLEAIDPDALLAGTANLSQYRSIVIADDAFPGFTEPAPTGLAQPDFATVTGAGLGTAPCAYQRGTSDVPGTIEPTPGCFVSYEFDIDAAFNNQRFTATLDTANEGLNDWDLYVDRLDTESGTWFEAGRSAGGTGDESVSLPTPQPGQYRVLVVNWSGAEPPTGQTLTRTFSNVYQGPPIGPSVRTEAERDQWGANLLAYVQGGGNLVLTDGALKNLGYMNLIAGSAISSTSVYAGFIGFTTDGSDDTYSDPLAINVNQPGAAEGLNHRHQTYEPVPIGFSIQDDAGNDANNSPVWTVDKNTWEAAGGRTAGITGGGRVSLGELAEGDGVVRIIGPLLPMPSQQFYHPYGLASYALSYTGYQVLNNALQWNFMAGVPPTANDDFAETDDVTAIDIAVLANDIDPETGTLTIDSFTQPAPGDGTVSDNGDGSLKYTPVHGSVGTVTFEYTAKDSEGLTDTATVSVLVNDHHELDPFRNDPIPCNLLAPAAVGSTPRAALNMVHITNICGFVGVDIEFQSRLDANGNVHDYVFVSTMGYGFNIYDVTDPHVPFLAGGFLDQGWENDIQVRGDVVVLTFDGVSGEDSTTSLCLRTNYPAANGQGVDIFRLNYDPAAAATGLPVQSFVVTNPTCVPNPPGGAHNSTLHPSGDWLAISNCCSDWAMDLIDLRDLDNGNAVHTYRFIDASRLNAAGRCPTVGVTFRCVVMTRPNGSSASGLWQPHDVFFSEDGTRAYVAAINSSWIVDVSEALNGAAPSIAIISNNQGVGGDNITISHQADTSADGDILLLTDEFGGGLTGTDCQTELSGAGKIGAGHFWALAPVPGQPSTDAASESNPVRLGHWINPNPLAGEETIPRAERACTIHVFRMGGNGTSSPGPIQAGFDGVSTLGARELTVAMYGAGVWFMDFSSPPNDADGVVEDATTTWGNTLGYIIMPGADTWSAKEYKGYVYAGDIARGFDIYGLADCANVAECIIDPVGNNPPNAEDDSASVNRGDSVLIDVLANDSDPDCIPVTGPCDTITITSFTQPAHGTLIDNGNGTFTYDHDGSAAAGDSFRYVIHDGRGGADSATVTIAVNAPPIALDDTASVAQGGSVNIDVKANDSDADDSNSALTVSLESGPTNGVAVVEVDGSITYSHNGTATTGDSFTYRLTDPHDAFDTATVSITVTGPSPEDGIKTIGGGYLLTPEGDKINFGFNARVQADGSLMGDLRLSDKNDSVKVHLKTLTALGGVTAPCGSVPNAATSVEFRGSGTFGKQAATFRVCVQDNGEPDNSGPTANPDLFHLECVTGCVYTTTDRVADERIDGGNIQVHQPEGAGGGGTGGTAPAAAGTSGSSSSSTNASASTLILDPVLLTEGTVGSLQTLTVRAFDANQAPLAGANLTLRAVAADGSLLDSLVGLTDASGIASFSVGVVLGEVEYLVWSGTYLSSNAIELSGLTLSLPPIGQATAAQGWLWWLIGGWVIPGLESGWM